MGSFARKQGNAQDTWWKCKGKTEKSTKEEKQKRLSTVINSLWNGMDWNPIVISRAGSCPAVDAKSRMAEIYRKEMQGSVLAWRAASLLLNRLLLLY